MTILMADRPEAPRGLPLLGMLPRLLRDPARLAVQLMHEGDRVVPLRLGPVQAFFVHHPDHLRHIMLDNQRNYTKGPLFARADLLVGQGLVVNEGEAWLRQRRLLQPPFAPQRMAAIIPRIVEAAQERVAAWRRASGPIEMGHEMSVFTMTSLLKSMFGIPVDDALLARVDRLFDVLGQHVALRGPTFFLPESFPLPGRSKALAAVAELHELIDEMIAARRGSDRGATDLLGLMLEARDETGAGMTEIQLRDEIKTMIFAGYDSTAAGLAWTWSMLATHPESARRARGEVLRVLPEGDPSMAQLGELQYVGRVFQDTLRLYPPFSFHPRTAIADDVIAGQRIPAGSTLIYSNYAPGRNPAYWDYPDAFYPDHFLPEQVARRHRFAYVPFGAGPRMCIGMSLATLEAKVLLALALRELEIARPLNVPIMQARFGTTRARGGIWLELRARRRPT
jgi:cytochrome P450